MLAPGYRFDADGAPILTDNIYWSNLIGQWWLIVMLLVGVLAVLYGLGRTVLTNGWNKGVWFTGIGTVLAVLTLFCLAGYNNTAYYPSLVSPESSLSIANSSSSEFTLRTMAYVSISVPFVLGYIWYVWRKMNATPLSEAELSNDSHQY